MLGGASYAPFVREYAETEKFILYSVGSSYNQALSDNSHYFFNIDASNKEDVIRFITEHKIDGLVSLGNENLINVAIDIAEETNLNFYINKNHWFDLQDKMNFKKHCKEFDIDVVDEYNFSEDELNKISDLDYPVVFKPCDSSGSNGITICSNEKDVIEAINKAKKYSRSHRFIVERYMKKPEFIVSYIISNGEATIWMLGDRYMNTNQEGLGGISNMSVFPSKYSEIYLKSIDEKMKQLLKKYGPKNGTFFAQGFVDDDKIFFFDPALRFCGTLDIIPYKYICGINPLHWMINHSLTGVMDLKNEISKMDWKLHNKTVLQLSILLKTGQIGSYLGFDDVNRIKEVIKIVKLLDVNDIVNVPGTLQQVFARIYIVCNEAKDINTIIDNIYNVISVKDIYGSEMIMPQVKIK